MTAPVGTSSQQFTRSGNPCFLNIEEAFTIACGFDSRDVLRLRYVLGDGAYPVVYVVIPHDTAMPMRFIKESDWDKFMSGRLPD